MNQARFLQLQGPIFKAYALVKRQPYRDVITMLRCENKACQNSPVGDL
jgi:hypothetical protein